MTRDKKVVFSKKVKDEKENSSIFHEHDDVNGETLTNLSWKMENKEIESFCSVNLHSTLSKKEVVFLCQSSHVVYSP